MGREAWLSNWNLRPLGRRGCQSEDGPHVISAVFNEKFTSAFVLDGKLHTLTNPDHPPYDDLALAKKDATKAYAKALWQDFLKMPIKQFSKGGSMFEGFKKWFFTSITGFFLGFLLVIVPTGLLLNLLTTQPSSEFSILNALIGGIVGSSYYISYSKRQKKYFDRKNDD